MLFSFKEFFYKTPFRWKGRGGAVAPSWKMGSTYRQVFVKKIQVNNYKNVEDIQFWRIFFKHPKNRGAGGPPPQK